MENSDSMSNLVEAVKKLKTSEVKNLVDARMEEFKELGKKSSGELFNELCFCILTANFNAARSIKIQQDLGDGFYTLPEAELAAKLREFGHRYPEARAGYIVEARRYRDTIKQIIEKTIENGEDPRRWLTENVKGVGYKLASHFLRNIGRSDFAILDFHVIDILARRKLIERPKTLTPKKYLEIEKVLKNIADKANLSLGELDLYLWYMETGKVLK